MVMKLSSIKEIRDKLQGGLAKGKPDSDFDKKELELGIRTELEHTTDRAIAKEIAKDHLTENPKYYSILKKTFKNEN